MRSKESWFSSRAHLDDAARVGHGVVGVLLVLHPPQEVGGVLAVAVARGLLRQQLRLRLLVGDHAHHRPDTTLGFGAFLCRFETGGCDAVPRTHALLCAGHERVSEGEGMCCELSELS
jgi:hypothetical protein